MHTSCVARLRAAPARSIGTLLTATTAANGFFAAYLSVLTLAGARPPRAMAAGARQTRFAVMTPAHNEEAVIADALRALCNLDYPRDRFDVHVVADNCTDATADIVRSFGWTVHERHAPDDPGKGPALNWLFDRLDEGGRYDVAVIVDADSVVDRSFLVAIDQAFSGGARAAQGFYSVRDPELSPSAGVRYIALACRHHLRPLGRCRLGGSAGLYGNGMAFEWAILRRRRWSGHLVEDAEFQLELLLDDDIVVKYVPGARLVAEMPATLEASNSQNARWERGRLELVRHYAPRLLGGVLQRDKRQVARADALVDLALPPLSVLAAAQVLTLSANAGGALAGSTRARARAILDVAGVIAVAVHVLTALRAVDAPRSIYRSLARVPRMILWKVRLWLGVLRPSADVNWQRTERNADLSAARPGAARSPS